MTFEEYAKHNLHASSYAEYNKAKAAWDAAKQDAQAEINELHILIRQLTGALGIALTSDRNSRHYKSAEEIYINAQTKLWKEE